MVALGERVHPAGLLCSAPSSRVIHELQQRAPRGAQGAGGNLRCISKNSVSAESEQRPTLFNEKNINFEHVTDFSSRACNGSFCN